MKLSSQDYTKWKLPEGAKARFGKGSINDIAYSSDGNHLAVASSIGIWLYNVYTIEILHILICHTTGAISVVFSPDGKTIANVNDDGTIQLWNTTTGKHKNTLSYYTVKFTSVVFSPDGKTIACVSKNGMIHLWNAETGELKNNFSFETVKFTSVVFSPDGKTIACVSKNGMMQLWDVISGKRKDFFPQANDVCLIVYSPDKQTIASTNLKEIHLWDLFTGAHKNTLKGHTHVIRSIAYSPDGKTIATGGLDGYKNTVKLWNAATGKHKNTLSHYGIGVSGVLTVVYSPDGKTIACTSSTQALLWDTTTKKRKNTLEDRSVVRSVAYSPDGKTIACASFGEVKLWDTVTGNCLNTLVGYKAGSTFVAYSPDGKTIAGASGPAKMASSDGGTCSITGDIATTLQLWDVATRKCIKTFDDHGVTSVAYSPDGKTIAGTDESGIARLRDTVTGKHKITLVGIVSSIAYSPDGKTVVGSSAGSMHLWDAETEVHKTTLTGNTYEITSVVYSPDGSTIAGASYRGLLLWDAETGVHKTTLQESDEISFFAYSPDSKTIATTSCGPWKNSNSTIRLWNWDAVAEVHVDAGVLHIDEVASVKISSIMYSPDGQKIAGGDKNGTVILWDAVNGQQEATFFGHTSSVTSVVFSPNSDTLASGSSDGTVLLWRLTTPIHQCGNITPLTIHGNWRAGWALDIHTLSSRPLQDGGYETQRTELGELVFQVKYRHDRSKIPRIAETAAQFIKEEFAVDGYAVLPYLTAIIPIPPSDMNRAFQPVTKIAQEIGKLLNLPVRTDYLTKIKQTVPLKNLPDVESKREQLKGAFVVQTQDFKDRCVLLFDDLYDSGVTLTEVSKVLYEQGSVRHVLVLTLTRTRTGRG